MRGPWVSFPTHNSLTVGIVPREERKGGAEGRREMRVRKESGKRDERPLLSD